MATGTDAHDGVLGTSLLHLELLGHMMVDPEAESEGMEQAQLKLAEDLK